MQACSDYVALRDPRQSPVRCRIGLALAACLANVAATGSAQPLQVRETDQRIVVRSGDATVVAYNKKSPPAPAGIDPVYRRSGCLHPVMSPKGRSVTEMFPFDHPHQHGVFSAWVKTTYAGRPVDFWNLAGRTGRVLHERVVATFQKQGTAGFEVDLLHRIESQPPVDVLRERWKVTVFATRANYHAFDLETRQTAMTDEPLRISKHHYGGIVLRGPTRWLTAGDRELKERPDHVREPSEFGNDLGSDRIQGNHQHAKWVVLSGQFDGHPVSIAVLGHPKNFRAPQAARLHPTKPYFCYAPCVDGPFVIDRQHPFQSRYRFLITDAAPDPAWLNQQWESWIGGATPPNSR